MAYKLKQPTKHKSQLYENYILYGDKEKDEESPLFEEEKEKLESEPEEKKDLFSMEDSEKEKIKEMNDELYADKSPIQIKDNYTLLVKASGQDHKITRKDISEYQRKYGLEDGSSDDRAITTFRSLGSINGDYEMVNKINKEAIKTFHQLDEQSGSFKTVQDDDGW